MSTDVIPAIVFRTGKFMELDELQVLIDEIKNRCQAWHGAGGYKAVLNFIVDPKTRLSVIFDTDVSHDSDGMDDVLLAISGLNSVKRYRAFDLTTGKMRKSTRWSGMKGVPVDNPLRYRHGYDVEAIEAPLRSLIEPDARARGREYAETLVGFPFQDMTAEENKHFIETNVIANLALRFPDIHNADRFLGGAITNTLRTIADPKNQQRLPNDWHFVFARMFERAHPNSFVDHCKHISKHLAYEDYIASMSQPQHSLSVNSAAVSA